MAWVFSVPGEDDFIPTTIVWVREGRAFHMSLPGPTSSPALNSLSPLSPAGCSSGGVEGWDWRAQAFPYSEKTICSYPIIICHNSYLTAFVWFTPGVVVHVIRTRHRRLVLHCKCNHFFEGKHLSLYPSHPDIPTSFPSPSPMPHCHFYTATMTSPEPEKTPTFLLLSIPSVSHQFHTTY